MDIVDFLTKYSINTIVKLKIAIKITDLESYSKLFDYIKNKSHDIELIDKCHIDRMLNESEEDIYVHILVCFGSSHQMVMFHKERRWYEAYDYTIIELEEVKLF